MYVSAPVTARGMAVDARRLRYRGVGLIEAAFAIVIVGVGAVAIMQFMATASTTNGRLGELSIGISLANSAMEDATEQGYTEIEKWLTSGAPTYPSADHPYLAHATGEGLDKYGWKQTFTATRVRLANLHQSSTDTEDACVRVTVTVSKDDKPIYTASRWFAALQ